MADIEKAPRPGRAETPMPIVVASPALLAAVPHSPAELRMVDDLCAFVEAAESR